MQQHDYLFDFYLKIGILSSMILLWLHSMKILFTSFSFFFSNRSINKNVVTSLIWSDLIIIDRWMIQFGRLRCYSWGLCSNNSMGLLFWTRKNEYKCYSSKMRRHLKEWGEKYPLLVDKHECILCSYYYFYKDTHVCGLKFVKYGIERDVKYIYIYVPNEQK